MKDDLDMLEKLAAMLMVIIAKHRKVQPKKRPELKLIHGDKKEAKTGTGTDDGKE